MSNIESPQDLNPAAAPPQHRQDIRLANNTWEAVMQAHANMMKNFSSDGVFTKLSMREYDVLYTLTKANNQPQRICDVQNGVLLSQPALSRLIDRLVARGLISRTQDEKDRRAFLISLTDAGAELQRSVGAAHAKSIAKILGAEFTAAEMQTLQALAKKLANA